MKNLFLLLSLLLLGCAAKQRYKVNKDVDKLISFFIQNESAFGKLDSAVTRATSANIGLNAMNNGRQFYLQIRYYKAHGDTGVIIYENHDLKYYNDLNLAQRKISQNDIAIIDDFTKRTGIASVSGKIAANILYIKYCSEEFESCYSFYFSCTGFKEATINSLKNYCSVYKINECCYIVKDFPEFGNDCIVYDTLPRKWWDIF